jgi:hypothetical protein
MARARGFHFSVAPALGISPPGVAITSASAAQAVSN